MVWRFPGIMTEESLKIKLILHLDIGLSEISGL